MLAQNRSLIASKIFFSGAVDTLRDAFNNSEQLSERLLEVTIAAAFAWMVTVGVLLALAESSV